MNQSALFVQPTASSMTASSSNNSVEQKIYELPRLSEIITELTSEFSSYKYTVYRCAAKIVSLQKKLLTANIPYKLVEAVLSRHGISESDSNLMVPPFQLTSLIHDIYRASESLGHYKTIKEYNLETASSVLSNFFWNIFDPHRHHSISLLEVKVTFILICKLSNNEELTSELYKLIFDRKSKCVSKFYFEYLLNIFAKILTYVGEGSAYGAQNILKVVEQTFGRCQNPMGLTEQQFKNLWTTTQTRFLIYANLIVTVKRIEYTEKLVHNNSCTSCGIEKIVGIRFKCRSCTNLSLCLKCFAGGYKTNKHQTGHRVYEMFNEDQPPKKISHYFAKLCGIFRKSTGNADYEEEKQFCNQNENNVPNETELVAIEPNATKTNNITNIPAILPNTKGQKSPQSNLSEVELSLGDLTRTALNASNVSARMQSLIHRLIIQNFKIEQYLRFVPTATPEQISVFLQSHQQFLTDIIKEMRTFKKMSKSNGNFFPTSSTPNHSGCLNTALILDSSNLSALDNNLTHSINGADVNRSYLEANKSDYSVNDVSVWFNHRKVIPYQINKPCLEVLPECQKNETEIPVNSFIAVDARETEITNFRRLLHKVKEIVEDSYSDNTELAAATQNLENVLDDIIKCEETRRCSLEKSSIAGNNK